MMAKMLAQRKEDQRQAAKMAAPKATEATKP
jgi:hypothetical protein